MTPAERAICALNLGVPDEVPTFELEFQLSEEFFGYKDKGTVLKDKGTVLCLAFDDI